MSALDANLPLHQMISGVLQSATEKLAAEQCVPAPAKTSKTAKSAKTGTTKTAEITDEDYVEKLASACDYLAAHVEDIESAPAPSLIREALAKMAAEANKANANIGAGKGKGALETSKPTPGHQKYTHDKPKTEDAAASEAGSKPTTGGHGAATQLENNMEKAPGQGSGSVPTAEYPAKGPLVNIKHASIRDFYIAALEGDAEKTASGKALNVIAHQAAEAAGAGLRGMKPAEVIIPRAALGAAGGGAAGALGGAVLARPDEQGEKHRGKAALKGLAAGTALGGAAGAGSGLLAHRGAQAARSLPGEVFQPASEQGIVNKIRNMFKGAPKPGEGSLEAMVPEGVGNPMNKAASAAELAKQYILAKLAGEDVMKANISSPKDASPLPGGGDLTVGDAEKDFGKQPGGPTGGFGNEGRSHIQSNQAAIDTTKKDAKGPVKSQLAQVLEEPALSPKTDTKLKENLRNTGAAGVKIAAVQAFLQKIAAEGCTCDGQGVCDHCNMKQAVGAMSKTAQMGGMGGAPGMGAASMGGGGMGGASGMGGPGMGQMADAGAGADGCTCGGAGECRVCKLKAALAEAKAQAGISGEGMASAAPDTQPSAVKDL